MKKRIESFCYQQDENLLLIAEELEIVLDMKEIVELGLKEKFKQLNEKINDEHTKEYALSFINNYKEDEKVNLKCSKAFHHFQHDLKYIKMQAQHGNKSLKSVYSYLDNVINQKDNSYTNPLIDLLNSFPIKTSIVPPCTVEISEKEYHLTHVKQKHKTSCGIACVSMIANIPYETVLKDAKQLFKWSKTRSHFRMNMGNFKKILNNYGIGSEYIVDLNWKNCADLSIAVINHSEDRNTSHAVVFFRKDGKEYVLDPEYDSIRTDFYNMNLYSFINIC